MIALNENHQDRELLMRAARGCRESLEIVWHKYKLHVHATLAKKSSPDTAEDICQTIFLRLCEGKCNYDGHSDVEVYLLRVGINILKEELRSASGMIYDQDRIDAVSDNLICDGYLSCPVKALISKAEKEQQDIAILELPPKSREAVKLVFREGIPAAQAAEQIGCDFKMFRDRLDYGIKCLQRSLKDDTKNPP